MSEKRKIEVAVVKLENIETSEIALRSVNTEGEDYKQLRDSIAKIGVTDSICVKKTEEKGKYVLVNGLQRYTSSKELGLEGIPCNIVEMGDEEMAIAQIISNSRRVKTKPIEYTRQIIKIFGERPTMTFKELCGMLCCTEQWLNERIGLLKLNADIQKKVDNGDIGLSNAFSLAKLPSDEQANYLSAALTEPASEFGPTVKARLNDIKKEKRGQTVTEFMPEPKVRKNTEIKDLYADMSVVKEIVADCKNAVEGGQAVIKWIVQMDDLSIDAGRAKFEQLKKEKDERQAIAAKKREEAKRAKAQALLDEANTK